MPRYKSKYKEDWENEIDASGEKIKKWVHKISDKIAKYEEIKHIIMISFINP